MGHEDFEQFRHTISDGEEVWVTLCSCGKAFWDPDSGFAYEMWEKHEANA